MKSREIEATTQSRSAKSWFLIGSTVILLGFAADYAILASSMGKNYFLYFSYSNWVLAIQFLSVLSVAFFDGQKRKSSWYFRLGFVKRHKSMQVLMFFTSLLIMFFFTVFGLRLFQ